MTWLAGTVWYQGQHTWYQGQHTWYQGQLVMNQGHLDLSQGHPWMCQGQMPTCHEFQLVSLHPMTFPHSSSTFVLHLMTFLHLSLTFELHLMTFLHSSLTFVLHLLNSCLYQLDLSPFQQLLTCLWWVSFSSLCFLSWCLPLGFQQVSGFVLLGRFQHSGFVQTPNQFRLQKMKEKLKISSIKLK